jgi:hypothetical protein
VTEDTLELVLAENVTPQLGLADPFNESSVIPGSGFQGIYTTRKVRGTHDQETRKLIALIILGLISVLYAGIMFTFLVGGIDIEKLTAAIAAMSGIQALAAAAIGFYYGSKQT